MMRSPQLVAALANASEQWRPLPLWSVAPRMPWPGRIPEAVALLAPESSPRYQPQLGVTACNIFLWDVTTVLGAEVPHWVGRKETRANDLVEAMTEPGGRWGYAETSPDAAQRAANAGRPVVVGWRNDAGPGHVALLLPGHAVGAMRVAQAGRVCASSMALVEAFGLRPVHFFVWSP